MRNGGYECVMTTPILTDSAKLRPDVVEPTDAATEHAATQGDKGRERDGGTELGESREPA